MGKKREVPGVIPTPTHGGRVLPCLTFTECAIHTIILEEGAFAAIALSNPHDPHGAVAILDADEVDAHIVLLRNAIEDAERHNDGKPMIHAAKSLRRS